MRSALVTGGNRGIGYEIAKGLISKGVAVYIAARDPEAGVEAADKLGAEFVYADLSQPFIWPHQALACDILVNNAGVLHDRRLLSHGKDFHEAMDVMVTAPFELIRQMSPLMIKRRYGRIVNVSSGWGSFSQGLGPNAYGIAKAALNAMTVALAKEVPSNVKINSMCPGHVRTRMGGPNALRTPEQGADTAIWLATLPDDGPTGGFFRDRKPITF
ncbi:MAG: SDR family NAD(P)-dependent oxidoreductase [Deltaproteobacteria bacterium]